LDLTGTWADTDYTLKDYKIVSFRVTIHLPFSPSEAERAFLEQESLRCPVYLSVKDSVKVKVAYEWSDKGAPATKKKLNRALSVHDSI
jgi:uncharacterized OsmC-like protein